MKSLHILLSTMILVLTANPCSLAQGQTSQAGAPRISNLKFSVNPVTPGIKFLISFEFEGDVDRLFIESTYETQSDEIKKEIKEYSISPEIKSERKGIISRQWETQRGSTAKPYRILSVWVKDAKGNQSNLLSDEIKIVTAMPANLRDAQWLLGSWTGILPGKEKTRTLKISEDKDGAKILYGITDEKMDPIAVTVNGNEVSFTTPASTQITLKRISERRMDGLFQPKGDAKPKSIKFWKDGEIIDVDSRLKAFSGTWQGESFWKGYSWGKPDLRFDIKVKVAYIDSTAAAVLRENSEFVSLDGFLNNANWAWCHATVTPKTIEFPFLNPQGAFVCELSSDGKFLQGEIKGLDGFRFSENSFKLKRVDNFGAATSGLTSDNNTIGLAHYKVEVSSDYKFVGKLNTEEQVPAWSGNGSFKTTTEHNLFVKKNDSGNVESFVIVRSQRISGTTWASEPTYNSVKDYIFKEDTEILGAQTKVVILRLQNPNARYTDMMKAKGLKIDQSYPKLVGYTFGKLASAEVLLEILCYYGEKTIDNDRARAKLNEMSRSVKIMK